MSGVHEESPDQPPAAPTRPCPPWCVTSHGSVAGEEDWLHTGVPLLLAEGVQAQACQSVDPHTGEIDGPYVVIGWSQYTPGEAVAMGTALIRMAWSADRLPRAARRRSPGP